MKGRMTSLKSKFSTIIFSLFVFTLVLVSCSEREAYYKFEEIKDANWAVEDVFLFEIDTLDIESNVRYNIWLEVTNNVDYPYQNLWIFSEYQKDDSTTVELKNEFTLADEFGKWQGSGFASLFQNSFLVRESIQFEKGKNYQIKLRHGMQDHVLYGIEKVGLKIAKAK